MLPSLLTVLSSILIVFAFTPWDFTPLIWICLIPWFEALHRAPTKRAAMAQGLWLSILMSLGGFYWVAHVLSEFGELPWAVGVFGLGLYSLVGQPQFTLFAPFWKWLRGKSLGHPVFALLGFGFAYAGVDWVLPKLFVDTLGHSFYNEHRMRQLADVGGATLLTFLVYAVNQSAWELIRALRTRREPSIWPALRSAGPGFLLSVVLSLMGWGYGWVREPQILEMEAHPRRTVQAGVIQANIGDFDKLAAERGIRNAGDKVLETFYGMSDQALAQTPKPQFLVWPETSYPSTFRTPMTSDDLAHDQSVESYVRSRGVPLLFGGYDRAEGRDYNAFFFLSPRPDPGVSGEGDLQVYRKNLLLLFGEYIPGARQIKFLRDMFPQVGNFGRGVGPEVLKIPITGGPPVLTGPIICYEALFPNYIIEAARKGSQLILNITNDSWFGPWGEPQLHLSLTIFRSIEARLPQLRSTNTGISTLILPDGEITHPTEIGAKLVSNVSIPILDPVPTLMKAWGDWFGPFSLGAAFLIFFWLIRKSRPR